MLSKKEEEFITYWQQHRQKQKNKFSYTIALPLSVGAIVLIMVNLLSGWDEQATIVLRSHSSLLVVIIIALMAIVFFVTLFASRYQWEQKEQLYKELLAKKEAENHS